jgi:hypothetical protein
VLYSSVSMTLKTLRKIRYFLIVNIDEWMTSRRPSLLEIIVVTDVFCPSQLCYHYNDAVLTMGHLPVATMSYDPLLQ